MADISAQDVAALRKATGAGMMDCKRALEESGGDLETAKTWLREKGLAGASKRAGREAADGAVEVAVSGNAGIVVELNCETDFVAKSDDFVNFVGELAQTALEHPEVTDAGTLSNQKIGDTTVDDAVAAIGSKVGEKVTLGRVVRIEQPDGIVDGYRHVQNDRGVIGVLVAVRGVGADDDQARAVAHDLALHIASAAPRWVKRDDVPEDVVDEEREVLANLSRNEGKPEEQIPKIVEGRINGFFKDNVLLEQGFVREPKRTISALIGELDGAEVTTFARIQVGEG